ncbi:PIN domain-containing protein [Streptomyces beijiangensis]|uniref:Ribonuclease VapC n=1 Tax=Streptomyces beijiangensis TaxID=163361 RepID=A0A939FEM6_9ACTN|nr:PIN domain-containing protein [Streptomyces beijiangensis]MBO0517207.1 PIN domain-containing protein [Streptomyces beijiangensis]
MTYLLDASALWYLLHNGDTRQIWAGHIQARVFYIAEPTRTEFLYSATGPAHRDDLAADLDLLCRPAPVPKTAWRWVDTAQYKLTQAGQHRSAGALDLLVCATAVHHGHTVLHADNDFVTVASVVKELMQRDVRT